MRPARADSPTSNVLKTAMHLALYHIVVLGSKVVRGIAQDVRFGGEVAAGMPPQLPPVEPSQF